jgi:putative spermidine/putrescine transport system permease protein
LSPSATTVFASNGGLTLRQKLSKARRRHTLKALGLIAPALLFLAVAFLAPMGSMLYFSINNAEVAATLPRATAALRSWDGNALPGEPAFAALAADLKESYAARTLPKVADRLNYELSGFRSLFMRSGRKADRLQSPPFKDGLIEIDERWQDLERWRTIKGASSRFTAHYLLAALDLDLQWDGSVERAVEERSIYIDNLGRTFWISFVVLSWCVLIGYPMAYLIASARPRVARILILLVLLPFWTSLLVRTAAWVALLQKEGVVNDALIWLGLVEAPIQLIFNRIGVYIAMVHLLLPFMILPLYAVMRGVPKDHMRAAASLGAKPLAAFLSVYLPQTMPGLAGGAMLVFIIALGFYITPSLVGGGSDQMLSYLIAQYGMATANWGMAAALAILLLACVAALYPIYHHFAGRSLRLG